MSKYGSLICLEQRNETRYKKQTNIPNDNDYTTII